MKIKFIVIYTLLVALVFNTGAVFTSAQDASKFIVLPPGTTFEGRLDHTIGSLKSHNGDKFIIEIVSPVIANGTDVVIPQGSKVIGEVVEAIPSSKVPRLKGDPKPAGKLQIALSTIETPDGNSYPIVGSILGEFVISGMSRKANPDLGAGIGYVGSQYNLNSIKPGANSIYSMGRQRQGLMSKKDVTSDPMYGSGDPTNNLANMGQKTEIRSLVKKNNELYIYAGSPLTVKLDTALKIPYGKSIPGINNANTNPTVQSQSNTDFANIKHFSRPSSDNPSPSKNDINTQNQDPF